MDFLTNFILYSFMIPMSLYVTIEFVKVAHAQFMEWDTGMQVVDSTNRAAAGDETGEGDASHTLLSEDVKGDFNEEIYSGGSGSGSGSVHTQMRAPTIKYMKVKSSSLNEDLGAVLCIIFHYIMYFIIIILNIIYLIRSLEHTHIHTHTHTHTHSTHSFTD